MILGEQAHIVIEVEALYASKVPHLLPGVETWRKVGGRWDCQVSEYRPLPLKDGGLRYEFQDTEQNRLTALIFWLKRGCFVSRVVPEDLRDPFPKKVQDAFHAEDKAESESDRKALAAAEKSLPSQEKKLEEATAKVISLGSKLQRQLDLADIDKKTPRKDTIEPIEKELAKWQKTEETTKVKVEELKLKIHNLKQKV